MLLAPPRYSQSPFFLNHSIPVSKNSPPFEFRKPLLPLRLDGVFVCLNKMKFFFLNTYYGNLITGIQLLVSIVKLLLNNKKSHIFKANLQYVLLKKKRFIGMDIHVQSRVKEKVKLELGCKKVYFRPQSIKPSTYK